MKKKINVIIRKSQLNNTKKGSIISVSRGYALNYLIPNQIAEIATKGSIKQLEMFQNINSKREKLRSINESIAEKNIKKIKKVCMYKKKGEKNLIFGSVTEKEIKNWINKYSNINMNKVQIKINESKHIGISDIEIMINSQIKAIIQLQLIPINI